MTTATTTEQLLAQPAAVATWMVRNLPWSTIDGFRAESPVLDQLFDTEDFYRTQYHLHLSSFPLNARWSTYRDAVREIAALLAQVPKFNLFGTSPTAKGADNSAPVKGPSNTTKLHMLALSAASWGLEFLLCKLLQVVEGGLYGSVAIAVKEVRMLDYFQPRVFANVTLLFGVVSEPIPEDVLLRIHTMVRSYLIKGSGGAAMASDYIVNRINEQRCYAGSPRFTLHEVDGIAAEAPPTGRASAVVPVEFDPETMKNSSLAISYDYVPFFASRATKFSKEHCYIDAIDKGAHQVIAYMRASMLNEMTPNNFLWNAHLVYSDNRAQRAAHVSNAEFFAHLRTFITPEMLRTYYSEENTRMFNCQIRHLYLFLPMLIEDMYKFDQHANNVFMLQLLKRAHIYFAGNEDTTIMCDDPQTLVSKALINYTIECYPELASAW